VQVKAKDAQTARADRLVQEARRRAAKINQAALRAQMEEKLQKDALDDVGMNAAERKFMAPLLKNAEQAVGRPHHINVM
jgi:hypothetical protein